MNYFNNYFISSGSDKLEPLFLKLAAEIIAGPLCHIFNLTLSSNEIPLDWKSALVIPLLKGGDPSNFNNYKPITKLSVLVKVLESLISEQVKDFLAANSILSGFRKNHSTVTAAMTVINGITGALGKSQCCLAFFIDLQMVSKLSWCPPSNI